MTGALLPIDGIDDLGPVIDESKDCPLTDLKPGDTIVAYMRGVHTVIAVQRRYIDEKTVDWQCNKGKNLGNEKSPLIHYRRRLNSNGNKAPNQTTACDAEYCQKVTEESIQKEHKKAVKQANKKRDAMLALLKEQSK